MPTEGAAAGSPAEPIAEPAVEPSAELDAGLGADLDDPGAAPGRLAGLRARADPMAAHGRNELERFRRTFPIVDLGAGIVERFTGMNGSILAGYLAYRLFLLLLPLAVIIVALAGISGSTTKDTSDHLKLGQALTATIATAGAEAEKGRFALLATGLVAFIFTAWGMLGALQFVYAQAWRIPTRRFPGKTKSFLRLAGSFLLFGLVFYVSALVRQAGAIAGVAGSTTTFASTAIAYLGLGWILPRRSKEWFWLLPGMLVGAFGHLLLQLLGTYYLPERLAGASHTYGAFGITVTVLFYLFLVGAILALSAAVNAVVWERYEENPPGIFRRIADRVPIPLNAIGSGYVPDGDAVETASRLPGSAGPTDA